LEWGREQRNVTKDMDSFDSKPDQGEVSATPMDPTIIRMPPCPSPVERMAEMICGDMITTQESRGIDNNNNTKNTAATVNGPRDIYLRHRQPGLSRSAGSCLMIIVDKVVNKTIIDLHISFEEPKGWNT
jgi:hypothetical protein